MTVRPAAEIASTPPFSGGQRRFSEDTQKIGDRLHALAESGDATAIGILSQVENLPRDSSARLLLEKDLSSADEARRSDSFIKGGHRSQRRSKARQEGNPAHGRPTVMIGFSRMDFNDYVVVYLSQRRDREAYFKPIEPASGEEGVKPSAWGRIKKFLSSLV